MGVIEMTTFEKKEDLRVLKTRKAIYSALKTLLNQKKFSKITVHDICEESFVSRTAFYAHFKDKYDLLEKWLSEYEGIFSRVFDPDDAEKTKEHICELFQNNSTLIINLFDDADPEQQDLIYRFLSPKKYLGYEINTVLSDFFSGGIFRVVFRQMRLRKRISKDEIRRNIEIICDVVAKGAIWGEGRA